MDTFQVNSQAFSTVVDSYKLPKLEALFIQESNRHIRALTKLFPQDLSPLWGYEIPLFNQRILPDFLFCVDSPWKLYEAFMDLPDGAKNPLMLHSEIFRRYNDVAALWLKQRADQLSLINNVWFEFDYANVRMGQFWPNFFFAPEPQEAEALVDLCYTVMEKMSPTGLTEQTYQLLKHICLCLPRKAKITQVGQMLARQDNHLRLFIQSIPQEEMFDFLAVVGYPHTQEAKLQQIFYEACQFGAQTDLDLDLGKTVSETLGFEIYFDCVEQVIAYCQLMTDRGWLNPNLYGSLVEHLQLLQRKPTDTFQHFFSHFKIVYHPNQPIKAKAYIAFTQQHLVESLVRINLSKS